MTGAPDEDLEGRSAGRGAVGVLKAEPRTDDRQSPKLWSSGVRAALEV